MTYWQDTKAIALIWLKGWGLVARHVGDLWMQVITTAGCIALVALSLLAMVLCLAAPFLFWTAPLLVPLKRRMARQAAAARAEAVARMTGRFTRNQTVDEK